MKCLWRVRVWSKSEGGVKVASLATVRNKGKDQSVLTCDITTVLFFPISSTISFQG